jgi:hypothetical protein
VSKVHTASVKARPHRGGLPHWAAAPFRHQFETTPQGILLCSSCIRLPKAIPPLYLYITSFRQSVDSQHHFPHVTLQKQRLGLQTRQLDTRTRIFRSQHGPEQVRSYRGIRTPLRQAGCPTGHPAETPIQLQGDGNSDPRQPRQWIPGQATPEAQVCKCMHGSDDTKGCSIYMQ